ncbi:MAG: CPBP family intramembrane glutamic endopeptidase [Leptolyngbyaceae cyanobacterium]
MSNEGILFLITESVEWGQVFHGQSLPPVPVKLCKSTQLSNYHVFNFAGIQQHFYLSPLIMLPYTVIGLVLGYVRIQYGFQWAVGLHAVNNAYAFLPFVIFYGLTGSSDMSNVAAETPQIGAVFASLIVIAWGIGSLWMMVWTCRHLWRDFKRYQLHRAK